MKQLILVRGPSGSGKTTFAKSLKIRHVESDDYFYRMDNTYDFNPRLLKNAHDWCYEMASMFIGVGPCVVANTFTRAWEMQKYIDLAKEMNVELVVYRCTGRYENVHGVPENIVQQMWDRMEDFDGEILIGENND